MASQAQGRITDEGIERMRERIGVVVPQPEPFNTYATFDGIRHFVNGYGDDNALYCTEEHGLGTRWVGQIAAPLFLTTMGISEVKEIRSEVRERGKHALAGVHEFFAGDEWEWFRPVVPGDRLTKRYYLYEVEEKSRSEFSGGRSVVTRYRADYINQQEELVAVDHFLFVRAEREAAAKQGKYTHVALGQYSEEDIEAIDAAYEEQRPARHSSRHWEDVVEGEELPAIVKGPLVVTDVIAWMRGWGGGVGHGRLAWQHRLRHPGFYSRNEFGAWDVVERVHWDAPMAQSIGNPAPYDFGRMRSCYLSQLVTDWMGDDAWLWKLSSEYRRFNFIGDVSWIKGRVVSKGVTDGRHTVDIEVWCENQRGEVSAPGHATVILPSRKAGAVVLPEASSKSDVPLIY